MSHKLAPVGGDIDQIVELFIVTAPDHLALAHRKRRVVDDGGGDQSADIFQRIDIGVQRFQFLALAPFQQLPDIGKLFQRPFERQQRFGVGAAVHDAAHEPFRVVDFAELTRQLAARDRIGE